MDEIKKYAAFSIPQREVQPIKEALSPVQTGPANAVSFTDMKFTEIEYDESSVSKVETARPFFSSATLDKPLVQRTTDSIREKFYSMRTISYDNQFALNTAVLFYEQAKFMEDFSDDYPGGTQFSAYYPCYQYMQYEQLRTYFTWRTKARLGEIQPTSPAYVLLYIYELLSGIGVKGPADGLNKLMTIWNTCREYEPRLVSHLIRWFKDYHVYYVLPHSFADFLNEHNLHRYYFEMFLYDADVEHSLEYWNLASSYDITKSKFYNAGNETLTKECFYFVLGRIREMCAGNNIRIEDLFVYNVYPGVNWYPFQFALFNDKLQQPDRTVEMSGQEVYYCRDNHWTTNKVTQYSGRKEFIGYLIKKMEACLRQTVNYKFKITANSSAIDQFYPRITKPRISLPELDRVVEGAVADFHRNMTRTVVTVDLGNLDRIRQEAKGTQDKLIVPEDSTPAEPVVILPEPGDPPLGRPRDQGPGGGGWDDLKEALSPTERQALLMALRSESGIKAFADQNNVMLEVLADNINEKATDCIGDCILELGEDMKIYDEYREKVVEMVG